MKKPRKGPAPWNPWRKMQLRDFIDAGIFPVARAVRVMQLLQRDPQPRDREGDRRLLEAYVEGRDVP